MKRVADGNAFPLTESRLNRKLAGDPVESEANADRETVKGFGQEWSRFDQTSVAEDELRRLFEQYFTLFPWHSLPGDAVGVDVGCGSGRWARFVAPRVRKLICVDASAEALAVARRNLRHLSNVEFHAATVDQMPIAPGTMDFCFSLGVLHHVPDTTAAIADCARLLKPGAPLLVYLYYAFDSRPMWYRTLWRLSDFSRRAICQLPNFARGRVCDALAAGIYYPVARAARFLERVGLNVSGLPLYAYRDKSFYTMRTDALDRFGTRLEQRFTRDQIRCMLEAAGLLDIVVGSEPPYWCAVARRAH